MNINAGIWIDTKQAIIIKIMNGKSTIKTIISNVETRERIQGETKKFGRFGNQYLTYEKNKENRHNEQIAIFLKAIIKEILKFNKVVIFGPSNMKNLLEKEIFLNRELTQKLEGIHTTKQLTENQKVAWVKDYYEVNA